MTLATTALDASGEGTLTMRVADPPPISYEATALGRATHSVRLVITNTGTKPAPLTPLVFRFRPTRDNVTFNCEDTSGEPARWPPTLEAGASYTLTRDVSCETPVPGRYEVATLGRPRGGSDASERDYGYFSLQVDAGANAPVHVPWEPALYAASTASSDIWPSKDPSTARVVVALINASRSPLALAPVHATMRVTRRGSTAAPCPERGVELAFNGTLASGSSRTVTMPLGCALAADAIYEVDVAIANAAGTKVHVATHAIRVGVIPPPGPRREGDPGMGKVIGGT
ncbi:MAG: hypothetical protein JWO86_6135 [Myxococcaceae bacterium]|nr:hypothetical protein [Myxococcaceae bacterium]